MKSPSSQTKVNSGQFVFGYMLAPGLGHLLFAASLMFVNFLQPVESSDAYTDGIFFTIFIFSTYGLVFSYVVIGIFGLPTAFMLHRFSRFNLMNISLAAIAWLIVVMVAFRYSLSSAVVDSSLLSPREEVLAVVRYSLLFAPFVLFAAFAFYWIVTEQSIYRLKLKHMMVALSILCGALAVTSLIRDSFETRIVAYVTHPNGSRLLVTQSYAGEPFTTEVFFDDGDGQWRWHYFDHEDNYWKNAETEIVGSKIRVKSYIRSIEFDTETGSYARTSCSGRKKTSSKSNERRTPPILPNDHS